MVSPQWEPSALAGELWESSPVQWLEVPGRSNKLAFKALKQAALPHSEAVVIVTGFNESLLKFVDLAADFHGAGFAVYLFDHSGQGLSEREACVPENRLQNAFVSSFQDCFVSDLIHIVDAHIAPQHPKVHVFAHSMGCLVTAHALSQRPELFGRVVMSAPAFSIVWGDKPPGLPAIGTKLLSFFGTGLGAQYRLAPAPGGELSWWNPHAPITGVLLTHNQERLRWYEDLRSQHPEIAMRGPSMGWLWEVTAAQDRLWTGDAVDRIQAPVLVLTAELDTIVHAEGQARFCRSTPRSTRVLVPGAYHELVFETPKIRNPVVAAALAWVKAPVQGPDPDPEHGEIQVVQRARQEQRLSGDAIVVQPQACGSKAVEPDTSLLASGAAFLGFGVPEDTGGAIVGLALIGAGAATATAIGLALLITRRQRL